VWSACRVGMQSCWRWLRRGTRSSCQPTGSRTTRWHATSLLVRQDSSANSKRADSSFDHGRDCHSTSDVSTVTASGCQHVVRRPSPALMAISHEGTRHFAFSISTMRCHDEPWFLSTLQEGGRLLYRRLQMGRCPISAVSLGTNSITRTAAMRQPSITAGSTSRARMRSRSLVLMSLGPLCTG